MQKPATACPDQLTLGILHALFPGYSLLPTLPCPRIRFRPLATHRQAFAMANSTITLNLSQPTNFLLHLTTQRTFHRVVLVKVIRDPADFIFRQLTSSNMGINSQLIANLN
jgi:hypothetical protein